MSPTPIPVVMIDLQTGLLRTELLVPQKLSPSWIARARRSKPGRGSARP